jgi:hypothetical protein
LSTAVWGFNSGESIDDRESLQVRDSSKCPEGDLPTGDTHLRHLAPGLARSVFSSLSSANVRNRMVSTVLAVGERAMMSMYPVAFLRLSEGPKTSVSSRSFRPGSVM